MTNTLTGILLAATAGLNSYIPLLGLALAGRVSSSIDLSPPFDVISTPAGIAILLFLLTIDLVIDKIPRLDHLNDLVNTALRPAAGMFLLMAVTNGKGEIDEIVAMMLGLLVAGAVHTYKSISRLRITAKSSGMGTPLVSLVEDGMAAMVTLLALTLPWLGAAVLAASGFALAWVYRVVPNSFGSRTISSSAEPMAVRQDPAGASIANESDEHQRAQS